MWPIGSHTFLLTKNDAFREKFFFNLFPRKLFLRILCFFCLVSLVASLFNSKLQKIVLCEIGGRAVVTPRIKLPKAEPIAESWSSLVEGDAQLDRPNSQTTMEVCHACVA